jgi:acyl dehydratase
MAGLVGRLGHNPAMLLHGEQELRCLAPLPARGDLSTTGVVRAIYDKGKGALVVIDTATEASPGEVVVENTYSLYIRGEGGNGCERGPKTDLPERPKGAPGFEVSETTSPEQAAIYRLSGDLNPIHIDPEVAAAGKLAAPILHGLCTFGYAGRVALGRACGGDPARFRSMRARFVGVVYPGDRLVFRGWELDTSRKGGRLLLEVEADSPSAGKRPVLAGVCEVTQ